ncbi:MAG: GtrA family protein [Patescibacteria group bacterium]
MKQLINHGRQFMRFGLVGVANSLLDFTVFFLLHEVFNFGYVSANGGAWLLAASFSFFGNKYWTFRVHDIKAATQYMRFLIVSCIGLGISTGLLFMLIEFAGIAAISAKVICIVIVAFWNFYANKLWTFSVRETVWK